MNAKETLFDLLPYVAQNAPRLETQGPFCASWRELPNHSACKRPNLEWLADRRAADEMGHWLASVTRRAQILIFAPRGRKRSGPVSSGPRAEHLPANASPGRYEGDQREGAQKVSSCICQREGSTDISSTCLSLDTDHLGSLASA
ncbi:hypothetical protein VTN77DRAFT_4412 [Rasamsonia byssochlamydoides]|uniref:uncharacterized protein n=1 Tax=Rasamsonia byssochlamydoides TaxID=89139 RepID=UPI003743F139